MRRKGPGMESGKAKFGVRSKFWIEDPDGKVVFGMGRYRILDAVRRSGSMQAAAKELRMSYRAVWMRIRTSEECIGRQLVVREGKGSRITPFAEKLMKQFKRLHSIGREEADDVYSDLMTDCLK